MDKNKFILDACCSIRDFWWDKKDKNTLYVDIRKEESGFCELRGDRELKPDIVADFRNLPFENNSFKLIIFDPPHLKNLVETSQFKNIYGQLDKETWEEDIKKGFNECWRVLEDKGVLIFKWADHDIKINKILEVIGREPLFGHKTRVNTKNHKGTYWFCFMKK